MLLMQRNLPFLSPPRPPPPPTDRSSNLHGSSRRKLKPSLLPISAPSTRIPFPTVVASQIGSLGFGEENPLPFSSSQPPSNTEEAAVTEESVERWMVEGRKKEKKHLSQLSSWGIGGPCRYFLEVSHSAQLISTIRYCRAQGIPFLIVGRGSNCLFDDRGFNGCVILNRLDYIEEMEEPGTYRVGSGYPFNRLGLHSSSEGFSGLEFAGGVPGTVGGAAFMNAGANGQETADAIDGVEIVTTSGDARMLRRCDLTFGYRKSVFQEMEDLGAILSVTFRLSPSTTARKQFNSYLDSRRRSQPIGERSAGSVFRNPSGIERSAGKLIEMAGLKGFRIGGAKVSKVHANFFINFDNSTSRDMLALISFVKEKVYQNFGVELKEEIRYVPYNVN